MKLDMNFLSLEATPSLYFLIPYKKLQQHVDCANFLDGSDTSAS